MKRKAPVKPDFEAVYLVDRGIYIYLRNETEGDAPYFYEIFSLEGEPLLWGNADGADPDEALQKIINKYPYCCGLDIARVGITTLRKFQHSEIYVRDVWEPETLPKDDIRFIDSQYNEQFRIPNGEKITVYDYRGRHDAVCKYIDDYHTYINGRCYHICQWAEIMENNLRKCRPKNICDD